MNRKVNKYMSMAAIFAVCSAIAPCNDNNTAETCGRSVDTAAVIENISSDIKCIGDLDSIKPIKDRNKK